MQISSAIKAAAYGAGFGALAGLGTCVWILPDDWSLFPGDTILAGAAIFGTLGLIFGESFLQWVADHWHWFT